MDAAGPSGPNRCTRAAEMLADAVAAAEHLPDCPDCTETVRALRAELPAGPDLELRLLGEFRRWRGA